MAQSSNNGVGYYNKYNKDNKDNILGDESSSPDRDNVFGSLRSGLSPEGENIPAAPLGLQPGSQEEVLDALLDEDQIKRAIIQFFDNGEGVAQRYKFKIRLNLIDKDNPEFIATLTKTWSNFVKYIPIECKDEIKSIANELRSTLKHQSIKPYLGKLHLNQGRRPGKAFTQIEPWTFVAVWFDPNEYIWKYYVKIQDWENMGELPVDHLTLAQQKIGIKGQNVYINPKYETRQRPKTWAELRAEKRVIK
jgi:hypothetical protein